MVGLRTPAARLGAANVLLSAPGAGARPMLLIDGAGVGRGVGMSRLGAEALAVRGDCYRGQTDAR